MTDNYFFAIVSADGYEGGDIYGMAGKSPGGQFTYPAFTFPGPQVSVSITVLF